MLNVKSYLKTDFVRQMVKKVGISQGNAISKKCSPDPNEFLAKVISTASCTVQW
jgi:hypothetical protein